MPQLSNDCTEKFNFIFPCDLILTRSLKACSKAKAQELLQGFGETELKEAVKYLGI